jgi:predicted nucleotide-binding protein
MNALFENRRHRVVISPDDIEAVSALRRRGIFVIFGRNTKARDAVFKFLQSLGLQPEDYRKAMRHVKGAPRHIIDIVKKGLSRNYAAVVLMTPDDEARTRREFRTEATEGILRGQARPNVLFEAGMAVATRPRRTVFVVMGKHRPIFSDLSGIQLVKLSNSQQKREEFRQWLINARCGINHSSTGWRRAGDFNAALGFRKGK